MEGPSKLRRSKQYQNNQSLSEPLKSTSLLTFIEISELKPIFGGKVELISLKDKIYLNWIVLDYMITTREAKARAA